MRMKFVLTLVPTLLASGAFALGQNPIPPGLDQTLQKLDLQQPRLARQLARLDSGLGRLAFDFDQAGASHDADYQRGESALDASHFEEAAKAFNDASHNPQLLTNNSGKQGHDTIQ